MLYVVIHSCLLLAVGCVAILNIFLWRNSYTASFTRQERIQTNLIGLVFSLVILSLFLVLSIPWKQ